MSRRHLAAVAVLLALGLAGSRAFNAWSLAHREFTDPPRGHAAHPQGVVLRDVEFSSAGGVVRGWLLPAQGAAAVVLVHGSPGVRTQLLPEALALQARGINALLLDLPGYGESDGSGAWGEPGIAAVRAAVDLLAGTAGVDPSRIGGFGYSMGSCILAQATARDSRLKAALLASAFTDYQRAQRFEYSWWGPLTWWPASMEARRLGVPVDALRTIDVIDKLAPRPLLLVHGSADHTVPLWMAYELEARASAPKELWVVPGGGHGFFGQTLGAAWFDRMTGFFERSLARENAPQR